MAVGPTESWKAPALLVIVKHSGTGANTLAVAVAGGVVTRLMLSTNSDATAEAAAPGRSGFVTLLTPAKSICQDQSLPFESPTTQNVVGVGEIATVVTPIAAARTRRHHGFRVGKSPVGPVFRDCVVELRARPPHVRVS